MGIPKAYKIKETIYMKKIALIGEGFRNYEHNTLVLLDTDAKSVKFMSSQGRDDRKHYTFTASYWRYVPWVLRGVPI